MFCESKTTVKLQRAQGECLGEEVEIRTYRMIDRQKEFTGILKDYDETTVTIEMEDETEKTFEKSEIALIRLAFDF